MAPAFLKKLSSRGIPLNALIMTIAISAFSLLTSVVAAETVYLWLIFNFRSYYHYCLDVNLCFSILFPQTLFSRFAEN
ncbi:hypothetical protein AAHB62_07995 [Bacillus cereus]